MIEKIDAFGGKFFSPKYEYINKIQLLKCNHYNHAKMSFSQCEIDLFHF